MIGRWAMIQNGNVINICLWDGLTTTWAPPSDVEMQPAPDHIGIGWRWENSQWIEPIIESTAEQPADEGI